MKNFLLRNKWLGFLVLLIYSLVAAAIVSKSGIALVEQYTPVVTQEVVDFLPITVQDGEIVAPENTVISKTYGDENMKFNVVLNTRVDEFESTSLSEPGLYLSRKFFYGVNGKKTEIQSLKDIPNGTLDKETLDAGAELFVKNTQKYMFPLYAAVCLLISLIAVLLYTLVMHWLMAIWFNAKFGQTLRINTLVYAVVSTVAIIGNFVVGIVLMFILMLLANTLWGLANK